MKEPTMREVVIAANLLCERFQPTTVSEQDVTEMAMLLNKIRERGAQLSDAYTNMDEKKETAS